MSTRTPRRSEGHDVSPGLVVSKLGIEAMTEGDLAVGLLCLKVTIPRDLDPRQQARWPLFSGPPPKLRSIPALYPLSVVPTLLGSPNSPQRLAAAVALLSLKPSAYPPIAPGPTSQRPVVDVSATTGQVYVVLEEGSSPPRRASGGGAPGSPAPSARSEWLIIMEIELPIQAVKGPSGDEQFGVSIPLPRCLDNAIKFKVLPRDTNRREFEIVTAPKVMRNPRPGGKRRARRSSVHSGIEEGWEDGEVPGVIDALSDDDDSDDEVACDELEGRFQSTDVLNLEWAFLPSRDSPPDLRIIPQWDAYRPLISVSFEGTLPVTPGPLVLEAVLPPGWGWSEIEIRGDGLLSWRSTDGEGWTVLESAGAVDPDDSTATIEAQRTPRRQTGLPPGLDPTDFSFELNSFDSPSPQKPLTPGRRPLTAERVAPALHRVVTRSPTPASVFQLEFEDLDYDKDDRVVRLLGRIVPLNLTLVSPGAPVQIPFVRFDDLSLPTHCTVACPQASFITVEGEPGADTSSTWIAPASDTPQLCDTTLPSIGVFTWTQDGYPIPALSPATIQGPVHVAIQRDVWAVQTSTLTFAWPAHAAEVGVWFPGSDVRVIRAASSDAHLPRALLPFPDGPGTEVRVGRGRGSVELVVEVVSGYTVAVPYFSHGKGDLLIELVRDQWDHLLDDATATNLEKVSERAYRGSLELPGSIQLAKPAPKAPKQDSPAPGPKSSWVSWNKVLVLALVFVILSLAHQVQRLSHDVAFLADEARDLRLYHVLHRAEPSVFRDVWEEPGGVPEPPIWDKAHIPVRPDPPVGTATVEAPAVRPTATEPQPETPTAPVPPATATSYPIGRVVKATWGAWTQHPAVRAVTSSVSWLWSAFAWLVLPG
ncbi:hypothetical protein Q8F55_001262 [Vanrija albida]|uniref:Protein PBN1 n=1 Tax=Vanrija albida TaxID=181172 RepID=A0ABR3QFH8_9TREE